MASTLTPRQLEVKALSDKGKKAPEIAKKLGISENAVYQHLRAIKAAGGAKPKAKAAAKPKAKAASKPKAKAGRQSARKRTRNISGGTGTTTAKAPTTALTAEELIRSEIVTAEEAKGEQSALIESLKGQIAEAEAGLIARDAEISRKRDVLAVLTGEKVVAAKPKPKAAKPKTAKPAAAKPAATAPTPAPTPPTPAQAAPAASQGSNGGAAATPKPASQAEREATADDVDETAAQDAAEAPQEAPATA